MSNEVPNDADYNARVLHPLSRFLREKHGQVTLERLAHQCEIPIGFLADGNEWISQRAFESFLQAARELFEDDDAFKSACAYRMTESYGLMRFLLWASSPGAVYAHAEKTYKIMSTIGSPKVVNSTNTSLTVRISSDRAISRLNCLVRQAQTTVLPTFWGLPPAILREERCIAHGDDCCEYHLRWFDLRRWYPPVLGFLGGAALALGATRLHLSAMSVAIALPLLGALVGFVLELQRSHRANLEFGAEQNEALRKLAEEESDARRELLEVHRRQREWTQFVEQDAAERAATIQSVVARIERSQQARDLQLRGFSHDINSPLSVMRVNVEFLRQMVTDRGPEAESVLAELSDSLERISRLLGELMEATRARGATLHLTPEVIDVGHLTERLRRRLRAMVARRDVRTSVFRTREAPDTIQTDPLLLDRITDNLLSNAAKYTERGSIVVEVDGSPGFLVLKVLDSGKGIDPERIERAFEPGGSEQSTRAANSYGLGLSVVVQLLAEVGGRLEVMSKPGVGTTFWAYLPVAGRRASAPPPARDSEPKSLVAKVVRIRKVKSA